MTRKPMAMKTPDQIVIELACLAVCIWALVIAVPGLNIMEGECAKAVLHPI